MNERYSWYEVFVSIGALAVLLLILFGRLWEMLYMALI